MVPPTSAKGLSATGSSSLVWYIRTSVLRRQSRAPEMNSPSARFAIVLLACACAAARTPLAGPGPEAALAAEADALAKSRRFQEASERYAAALAIAPSNLEVAKRALGSFWRAARYEDAYLWGQRVLAREPDSLDALFD